MILGGPFQLKMFCDSLIHWLALLHRSFGTKSSQFYSSKSPWTSGVVQISENGLVKQQKFLGRDPKAGLKSYKWLNTWDKLKVVIFIVLHIQSVQSIINCAHCGHSKIHCCRKSSKPNVLAAITLFFEECFNFTLINGMSRLGRQHKKCLYSPFMISHGSWGGIISHLWVIMTDCAIAGGEGITFFSITLHSHWEAPQEICKIWW